MLRTTKLLFCSSIILLLASCDRPSSSRISTEFNTQDASAVSQAPYLLPRCFNHLVPHDLKILIRAVRLNSVNESTCKIDTDEKNPDFSLQWLEAKTTSKQTLFAEVNVASTHVFSDKAEDRKQLKQSFLAFQQSLASLEVEKINCLNKRDAEVIRYSVANALPLRLDEILPYNYGFDSDDRVIDLQAGMRLRIEQGAYQFVGPEESSSAAYVGGGSVYLHVIQRPDQTLAFEPYLGSMKAIEASPINQVELGSTRMISGAMGLAAAGVSRRYARLVYPSQYPTTKNATAVAAENELTMRVGLLLADGIDELEEATKMYIGDSRCAANKSSVTCFYFSGRSFVIPEVLVKIQRTEQYVPIGTTLRDAFNRYSVIPINQIGNTNAGGYNPVLMRWMQPGLCRSNTNYQSVSILFEATSPVTASMLSQWDMPLLKGDELRW
jgi:hypothetical protein